MLGDGLKFDARIAADAVWRSFAKFAGWSYFPVGHSRPPLISFHMVMVVGTRPAFVKLLQTSVV